MYLLEEADDASPLLAEYVQGFSTYWDNDGEVLGVVKAAYYAGGLAKLWRQLTEQEKRDFFAVVEKGVVLSRNESTAAEQEMLGAIWCTGFLEALCVTIDHKELPFKKVRKYLGKESLGYMNAWNKFNGIKPYTSGYSWLLRRK